MALRVQSYFANCPNRLSLRQRLNNGNPHRCARHCSVQSPTMAKKTKRRTKRVSWTKSHLAELRKYSRDKLPVDEAFHRCVASKSTQSRNQNWPSSLTEPDLSARTLPPRKPTCAVQLGMSALGQQRTFPGCHSITTSAVASSAGEIASPSALAVFKFMTNSYFVGACTGRSAGLSPLRIRST
jgi:hypothetical protein